MHVCTMTSCDPLSRIQVHHVLQTLGACDESFDVINLRKCPQSVFSRDPFFSTSCIITRKWWSYEKSKDIKNQHKNLHAFSWNKASSFHPHRRWRTHRCNITSVVVFQPLNWIWISDRKYVFGRIQWLRKCHLLVALVQRWHVNFFH